MEVGGGAEEESTTGGAIEIVFPSQIAAVVPVGPVLSQVRFGAFEFESWRSVRVIPGAWQRNEGIDSMTSTVAAAVADPAFDPDSLHQ